jgi:hypothetical protein
MGKIVAVFQTQAEADAAMQDITGLGIDEIETAVYEGRPQDHPTGADTIPTTGFAGIPGPIRPTGAAPRFFPFKDIDLGGGDDGNQEFFERMYSNGATLVVIDAPEEYQGEITRLLSQHGGRFSQDG